MKRKIIYTIIAIFIWCFIWQIAAMIIDNEIFLPSPADTFNALIELARTPDFFLSILTTLKGIAVGTGMDNIFVEGANGGLHTNYEGKARAAVDALLNKGYDFAYVHVEAPDEMGHQGSVERKVLAIEYLDEKGIGIIIHYPIPPHLSEAYAYLGHKEGAFPITEK